MCVCARACACACACACVPVFVCACVCVAQSVQFGAAAQARDALQLLHAAREHRADAAAKQAGSMGNNAGTVDVIMSKPCAPMRCAVPRRESLSTATRLALSTVVAARLSRGVACLPALLLTRQAPTACLTFRLKFPRAPPHLLKARRHRACVCCRRRCSTCRRRNWRGSSRTSAVSAPPGGLSCLFLCDTQHS